VLVVWKVLGSQQAVERTVMTLVPERGMKLTPELQLE
jgi:hypothetical protein